MALEIVCAICATLVILSGLLAILVVVAGPRLAKTPHIDQVFAEAKKIIEEVEAGK